jgi:hypothetical protein
MRRKGLILALALTAAALIPGTSRATSCTDECYWWYNHCPELCQVSWADCWAGLQACLTSCAQYGWADQIC